MLFVNIFKIKRIKGIMTKLYTAFGMVLISVFLHGCSSSTVIQKPRTIETKNIKTSYKNDACKMLQENPDWLDATYASYKKWGTPISVQLSFVYHESSFNYNARPIKKKKLYEFGTEYASSALGFSQALNGTWKDYTDDHKFQKKSRTNFGHSVDFIGWYNSKSFKMGIKPDDAYNLYLAYHEGRGGWQRKYYAKKTWLKNYAKSVKSKSLVYSKQINNCNLRFK